MNSPKETHLKKNIKYLQIIRGFAAFFVVFTHSMWPFWIGGTAFFGQHKFGTLSISDKLGSITSLLFSNATAMVIVFFVLSGFVISYSYKKNKWTYRNFLINRGLRIYLPFIMSMILAGGILYFASKTAATFFLHNPNDDYNVAVATGFKKGLTVKNFIVTLLFYRSATNYFGFNYVYWSLLYEMIFYLLFPIILKNIKIVFSISLILHPIHFFLPEDQQMPFFLVFFFTQFLLYFSAGVLLFQWLTKEKNFAIMNPMVSKRMLNIVLYSLFFIAIALLGLVTNRNSVSFVFATVFACIWIYRILRYGTQKTWISNVFMFFGKISYSLYLVHVPTLLFFYAVMNRTMGYTGDTYVSPWIHFIFAFLTLPVAYIFYLVVEEFSVKLIEKHKKKIRNKNDHTPLSEITLPPEISLKKG